MDNYTATHKLLRTKIICKAVASVAMAAAVALAIAVTENATCLWALFFVCLLW